MVRENGIVKTLSNKEREGLRITYQGMEQGSTNGNTCSNLTCPATLAAASELAR
jgi:hypothetical protein